MGVGVNFFLSIFRDTTHTRAHIQEHSYYKVSFFSSCQQKVTNTHSKECTGKLFRLGATGGGGVAVADDGRRRERKKKEKRKHVEGWFPYTVNSSSCLFRGKAGSGGTDSRGYHHVRVFSNKMYLSRCSAELGGAHGTILIVWPFRGREKRGGFLLIIILPLFFFFFTTCIGRRGILIVIFYAFFWGVYDFLSLRVVRELLGIQFYHHAFQCCLLSPPPPSGPCDGEWSIPSCSFGGGEGFPFRSNKVCAGGGRRGPFHSPLNIHYVYQIIT